MPTDADKQEGGGNAEMTQQDQNTGSQTDLDVEALHVDDLSNHVADADRYEELCSPPAELETVQRAEQGKPSKRQQR